MASIQSENFNLIYQQLRSDNHGISDELLIELFNNLADRIILDFNPTSVLDANCGKGYLVRALRMRGVEAWGVDRSKELILDGLVESQPFCQSGSVLQPFQHPHYDLIICIECLEKITPENAIQAVENLSLYCDNILISCFPSYFSNSSRENAQPPEFWVALFNQFGFVHNINYDASFIAPWAMHLKKTQLSTGDLLIYYEQKLWLLTQENDLRRRHGIEQSLELSSRGQREQIWKAINAQAQADIQYWKATNEQTKADLNNVLNSTSWRFMTRIQRIRLKIIPLNSQREAMIRYVISGYTALRREGPIGFISLSWQKLKGKIGLQVYKFQHKQILRNSSWGDTQQICEIDSISTRLKVEPHLVPVDIIICVHNALEDVQRCLSSLEEHTQKPYNLILVDDGSDVDTAGYLREFASAHQAVLLRSEEATGYTYAANRGLRASSAESLVLLNSDTILTPEWLDRFVACMETDEKIGIVGPLSNTASWQSIPKIEQNGDWASNPLPADISPAKMAQLIASNSARLVVEMPLLNGFCLLIRRRLIDEVGLFDEENFGKGYGEEDDLVLRARSQGWKMALADDVYIFHAQSKSYSSEMRHALSERAGKILRKKHSDQIISQGIHYCLQDPVLEGIRARAEVAIERDHCLASGKQYSGINLLFVLPINSPGGGANVIRSESIMLRQMGVNIDFFNLTIYRQSFERAYPELSHSTIYGNAEDLESVAKNYDGVIATYNPTVEWLLPVQSKHDHPILGYYVQGFEPWMYTQNSRGYKIALNSYTLIDDMTLFCKTEWTRQQVKEATGRDSQVIGASVDIDLYRPRPRKTPIWPAGPLRIAAMIRPESPYREPLKTMQLLDEAARKYKGEVEILLFGTAFENPAFKELPHNFPFKIYGILKPDQVANLFSQSDIFVDYSSQQAMGLTAMEAMACGCATIVPQFGGASSYAIHEQNSLVIDSSSFDQVWSALQRLIDDETFRTKLQHNAIHDICAFYPEKAALNILKVLFKA
jgi:GT2 family glycosyltransferase/glycosyltransferase involved in cell wall biosynthesis/SAM-dependent methyltransferase